MTRLGLNVCGFFGGHFGLAQAARSMVIALESAGVSYSVNNYPLRWVGRRQWRDRGLRYPVTAYVCNPDFYIKFASQANLSAEHVACWSWELDSIPDWWIPYIGRFSQIWCPSSFVASAVNQHTDKARVIPHAIRLDNRPNRAAFGIPENRFTVLVMFDGKSGIERKNPFAAIEAFKRAKLSNGWLVVKGQNMTEREQGTLKAALKRLPHTFIEGVLERNTVESLIASTDCLLSLHRSEGFGLPLAEAMSLGKTAIATRYGGNLDYMTDSNSLLVDCRMVPAKIAPYDGGHWADPSISDAADKLRAASSDLLRENLGWVAKRSIRRLCSPERVGGLYLGALQKTHQKAS